MSEYYIFITDAGAALETAAHAAGEPLALTAFGVCDGGSAFTPDPTLTTLENEVYRGEISSLSISPDDNSVLVAQCIVPASSGGYTIRGIGLYAGDTLYALGNYPDQPKPAPDSGYAASLEILAQLAVSDTADVTLTVADGSWLSKAQGDKLYVPLTGSTKITGTLRTTGEVQSSSPNGFRIAYGDYGAFWRNDGANLYLMLTDKGDQFGNYNDLRPFRVDLAKGNVAIGTPLYVASTIQADKGVQSGYVGSYAFTAQFETGAAFYETFNTTGVSEFHPLLKQKATITNKAAWAFTFGSLCDNGKISWCLHMIDGSGHSYRHDWDISGNYTCPGQLIPGNYANFDARYQAKNTASIASSGWFKDSSTGAIFQWGIANRSSNTTKIGFPIAFPNACRQVQLTLGWAGSFHDQNIYAQLVDRTAFNYIAGSDEKTAYFWAVGY
ncbi:phage tail protein [Cronobacter muytjensii]|nr:phage tail protein [Cronobacter muytjensii]